MHGTIVHVGTRAASFDHRFERALENAERFFMKTGKVHQAAVALARRLDAEGIPYAIVGAMALANLPAVLVERLDPYVREKFSELWRAAQIEDPE